MKRFISALTILVSSSLVTDISRPQTAPDHEAITIPTVVFIADQI